MSQRTSRPAAMTSTGRKATCSSATLSSGEKRGSRSQLNTRLAFASYRRATWLDQHARHPRLPADHPLLSVRPDPAPASPRHPDVPIMSIIDDGH